MAHAPRIRHRVIQTRNTCSRAVLHEDTIVIRLARNLSQEERREHIRSLLRRMMEQVLKEQRKKRIAPFRHLLEGGETLTVTLASRRQYTFRLIPGHITKVWPIGVTRSLEEQQWCHTTPYKKCRGWIVHIGPHLRRPALHRLLWKLLAHAEMQHVETIVRTVNRTTLRVPIHSVKLAFAASQWGSCSPTGTIMLNTALLFLPRSILHYVIVHELAHRMVQNHSPRYWEIVKCALPNYRSAYQELQNYRLPSL